MSKEKKKVFKIVKTWYVEADDYMELTKDRLKTLRKDPDEIKIGKVRDW